MVAIDSLQLTRGAKQNPASGTNRMANRENVQLNEASALLALPALRASRALAVGHGLVEAA